MPDRISKTALLRKFGKMPNAAFRELIDAGVLPRPDDDGRWDAAEAGDRLSAFKALQERSRSIPRRVLLLNVEDDFQVPLEAKRKAIEQVLAAIRPVALKMAEVRRELAQLKGPVVVRPKKRIRLRRSEGSSRLEWLQQVREVDDAAFDRNYRSSVLVARKLSAMATAGQLQVSKAMPHEERLVLVFVHQLLGDRPGKSEPN